MLDGKVFYHRITERIVGAFGDLFNNMVILRKDSSGNTVQRIPCPLMYGPREKYIATVDRTLSGVQLRYPMMAFEMTGMTYAPDRKTATMQKLRKTNSDNTVLSYAWNPVPYDLSFDLVIATRFTSDGLSLVEQIIPYFTPEFNLKMRLIDQLNYVKDVPVVLEGPIREHVYQSGQEPDNKVLTWTLNFKVKTEYIGYIQEQGVITNAITHMYASNTDDDIYLQEDPQSANLIYAASRHTVVPDPLTANANSTFDYSESWVRKYE
jgi:hypothetical protein